MSLAVLYRGPLSSCNYDCGYCPFAKHVSSPEELEADREGLARFVAWVRSRDDLELHLLFTPWGEALVRPWYRQALLTLSHLPQVRRVAAQTNLSGPVEWMLDADRESIALWVTYHPDQVPYARFLDRVRRLHALGVAHSVGVVGLHEHQEAIARLRRDLADDVYLWVNAYKSEGPDYYSEAERTFLAQVDPLFVINNTRHASRGEPCRAGETAISVDGEGRVRRCHFVPEVLGNLYVDALQSMLAPRACPNQTCGCHIGYVHLTRLAQSEVYGDGLMARIPVEPLWRGSAK